MKPRTALFVASLTSLFLELLLIRWVSTEIPMLAYFKNFPLLAAFTGLGVGCLLADGRRNLYLPGLWVICGLCLVVCLSEPLGLDQMVFPDPNLDAWESTDSTFRVILLNLGVIFALLGAICFAFIGLGQAIGRLLRQGSPLGMYNIDILGSLAGTILFALLSFWQTAPHAWLAVLLIPAWLTGRSLALAPRRLAPPLLVLLLTAGLSYWATNHAATLIRWSPYYKIQVEVAGKFKNPHGRIFPLLANHYIHQNMVDLSKATRPHPYPDDKNNFGTVFNDLAAEYNLPYFIKPNPGSVLIAGAGSGNDAAAALRNHAGHVTAVEIDPGILALGRAMHPEHPYAPEHAGTVEVVNNDIRSYLRRTGKKFDLVVYSILDSHTALSSLSSIRLDNYVYTREGLADAARHLKPGGLVCLSFFHNTRPWISQRIYNTIRQGTGLAPVSVNIGPVSCFIFGAAMNRPQIEARVKALGLTVMDAVNGQPVRPSTDDWPFLYSNPGGEPWVYYFALAMIVLASAGLVRLALRAGQAGDAAPGRMDWHMFFLGAGFLLVETKALAELSLLFGSTWVVNTFVFAGVFVMVLLANAAVRRGAGRFFPAAYALLLAALLAWYFFPRAVLNSLAFTPRAVVGTALVVLPLFFAGIIFGTSFARRRSGNLAFGANLLGAVIGGAMEASSLTWGIRALTLLAIAFYVGSFVTRKTPSREEPRPAAPAEEPRPAEAVEAPLGAGA